MNMFDKFFKKNASEKKLKIPFQNQKMLEDYLKDITYNAYSRKVGKEGHRVAITNKYELSADYTLESILFLGYVVEYLNGTRSASQLSESSRLYAAGMQELLLYAEPLKKMYIETERDIRGPQRAILGVLLTLLDIVPSSGLHPKINDIESAKQRLLNYGNS
jgi:hypothetical protein